MRVLNQTLSTSVLVFFNTNTLSENFVILSAERCPFLVRFPTSKKSIFATSPLISLPTHLPALFLFQGHPSHTTSPIKITCVSSIYLPFQGATFAGEFPSKTYGESFSQNIVFFAKIPYFLLQILACPGVRTGRFLGVGGKKFRDFPSEESP